MFKWLQKYLRILAKVLILFCKSNCKLRIKDYKWSFRNWKFLGVSLRNPSCCSLQYFSSWERCFFSDCSSFFVENVDFFFFFFSVLCPWLFCVDFRVYSLPISMKNSRLSRCLHWLWAVCFPSNRVWSCELMLDGQGIEGQGVKHNEHV